MGVKINFYDFIACISSKTGYTIIGGDYMLIEFSFKNYRSFRDETVLSMEATRIGTFTGCLIAYNNMKLLPGAGILGKNGGGKAM